MTGGAGFIGSNCVDALLGAGHHVVVLDDFSSGRNENLAKAFEISHKKGLKFRVIRGSVSDPTVWAKVDPMDAVFHFAAQTSVTASVKDPDRDFQTNVLAVQHLLQWVRSKKVRMLLYANTAGAMYGKAFSFPTDERALVKPLAPYGATKSFMETYLFSLCLALKSSATWSDDAKADNYFSWVSMRLSNVYGPRQITTGEAGVMPIFMETLGKGDAPTIFGDGSKTRDYIHVSDVVAGFMLALEKLKTAPLDEPFNLGTGIETRDLEVFQHIMKAMHEIGSDPGSHVAFKNSLKISAPNFAPIRAGESTRSLVDIAKIQAFLGWRPRIQIYDGIRATVQGYFD